MDLFTLNDVRLAGQLFLHWPLDEPREGFRTSEVVQEHLSVEHREPYGRGCRVGPVDPVAAIRRDVEPIAGLEDPRLGLIGEAQSRPAGENQYPFGFRLVVPEPRRARLAQGDDPFDPQTGSGQQGVGLFGRPCVGERSEKIHGTVARTPVTARFQPA